ncbi:MAG: hypothetical protein ABFR75_02385 [Acidobacteriota bacterium]
MEKLFRVYSIMNGVSYENIFYDNVVFNWFIIERESFPFKFEQLIINYDNLEKGKKKSAKDYISEQFTNEESRIFKDMLDKKSSGITKIVEVKLPVSDNSRGYNSLEIEQGKGFSDLYKKDSYDLPFKVRGFFNINDADKRIIGDDNPTVISRVRKGFFENKE